MKVFMSTRHLLSLLIAMTFSLSAFAQDLTVTGTVYDETGEPLIGASVQPKGTNVGVMTDIDGNYTIKVASNATLNFSYIGCVPQAIAVDGRTKIDVTLKNDSQVLDEVVAIGYGTVKKKDLTGAVSTVSGADLAKVPVSSAAQALQGKASGLNIVSQNGAPGAGFNVTLRGGASITQDTEPLYVVDGFVMSNALTNIDINDIESIDVLKDASATAIYGARGSNGIIVITTKKASKGTTRVDYNGYVSFDTLSKKLKMMSNPVDYVNYQYEMAEMQAKTSLWAVGYDNAKGVDEDDFYSGVYGRIYDNYLNSYAEDWQDLTFGGHATTQSHNVSITTGSDKVQALVSYNYTDQDGLLANHDYKRNSVRSKINAELWKGIKFDFGAFYYENVTHGGGAYSGMKNVLLQPINGGTMFTRDQLVNTQTFPTYRGLDNGYDTANPLVQNLASTSESKSRRFEAQAGITLDLVKNFVWRTAYHYTTNWGKSTSFADENSTSYLVDQVNTGMNGGISNSEGSSWGITNTLTYTNTFAQKHDVTFMLGQEYSSSESTSNKMTLIQFPYPNHKLDDISVATVSSKSSGHSHGNMLSFFARANYGYDDRYLLTATFRADGSSKFAKGNKWGFFPSASGAWRVSQEKFWQESGVNDWFNNLKFRVGYGVTGNNGIGSNLYVTNATMTSYPMDNNENSPAYVLGITLGNAKLKWEPLHATNIGLDLGFLNNRIMLTVEWYNNQISDMLMNCV
ncbi:MAG: SusC/RagA family TonB-linked outer membrane protein, partial [Muribaculaceae bacterium]|nr:SusC/RagA family TonB-linked outer membrane protein [Muribaculaceae bacterium]